MPCFPIKFLILTNNVPTPATGSGYVVDNVISALLESGFFVDCRTVSAWGVGRNNRGARLIAPFRAIFIALHAVCKYKPDCVICFGGEWGVWTALQNLRWRRKRSLVIHYSNGVESHVEQCMLEAQSCGIISQPAWYQLIRLGILHNLAVTYADHVVVVSDFDRNYVINSLNLSHETVTTLPNPISNIFLKKVSTEKNPASLKIGFCGNWVERKNIDLIKNDVQQFLNSHPTWCFEAVGSDTEKVNELNHPRMFGLGAKDKAHLPDWYKTISILMLPSIYESFGLAAAEAMACGCAVVSTQSSGFAASLRHGEEVYILRDVHSPSLLNALTELADNTVLLRQLMIGGHRVAKGLTEQNWRSDFLEVINRLLRGYAVSAKL